MSCRFGAIAVIQERLGDGELADTQIYRLHQSSEAPDIEHFLSGLEIRIG
jgi:hypothetical protein